VPGELQGLRYWEVGFDERGRPGQAEADALLAEAPASGVRDLLAFSHGWNNDRAQAQRLYRLFLGQVPGLLAGAGVDAAGVGCLGVVWPSKRWADEAEPTAAAGGAAAFAPPAPLDDRALVTDLASVFPDAGATLDQLGRLLAERPADQAELRRFQSLMGALAGGRDAAGSGEDHGEVALVEDHPQVVFARFAGAVPTPAGEGGAAGLGDAFSHLWDGAKEALRQLTYFEMKKRAGVVGRDGLGPLLGRLHGAAPELRVHLIGHSFGARLVSYALAGLPGQGGSPVGSLYMLQGAFSHFAFAERLPMDPGRGGALKGMAARVAGPLVVSFSVHDLAVGRLYPLASMSSRDDTAGADDLLYRWGGMGHDGAQASGAGQAPLAAVGAAYPFQPGGFTNLDCNAIVSRGGPPSGAHSDIFHPELVWAGLTAAGLAR
jgi:hypothetical protein